MSFSGQQSYTAASAFVNQADGTSDSMLNLDNAKDIFVFGTPSHMVEARTQLSSDVSVKHFTNCTGSSNGSRLASSIGSDGEVPRERRRVGVDAPYCVRRKWQTGLNFPNGSSCEHVITT
jgi:hypothetical protein